MITFVNTLSTLDRLGLFNKRLRSVWKAKISKVNIFLEPRKSQWRGKTYFFSLKDESGKNMTYPPLVFLDLEFFEERVLEELRSADFEEFTNYFMEKEDYNAVSAPLIEDPLGYVHQYGISDQELEEYRNNLYRGLKDFYARFYNYLNSREIIKKVNHGELDFRTYTKIVEACIQSLENISQG